MELLDLPNELLEAIGKELESESDIAALIRANHRLHDLLVPHLYRFNLELNSYDDSAEYWAAYNGRLETLKVIYSLGLQSGTETVYYDATEAGHENIVEFLLDTKMPNMPTPAELLYAAGYSKKIEITRFLLDRGAPADSPGQMGQTPLFQAVKATRTHIADLLLNHGANVNATDIRGMTPLGRAAIGCRTDMVKFLIEKGANVDARGVDGHLTALHQAALEGELEMVNLLLDKGANPLATCSEGKTPLHTAVAQQEQAVVERLLEESCFKDDMDEATLIWTPLHEAIFANSSKIAQILMSSRRGWINQRDTNGRTPAFYAARFGYLNILRDLLAHDADLNIKDMYGATPIFAAVRNDRLSTVEFLLNSQEDFPQDVDGFGRNLIWWAKRCGKAEIIFALIKQARKLNYEGVEDEIDPEVSIILHNREGCWCDICTRPIGGIRTGHKCPECLGGHFVICRDCHTDGRLGCHEQSHRDTHWARYFECTCPQYPEP